MPSNSLLKYIRIDYWSKRILNARKSKKVITSYSKEQSQLIFITQNGFYKLILFPNKIYELFKKTEYLR